MAPLVGVAHTPHARQRDAGGDLPRRKGEQYGITEDEKLWGHILLSYVYMICNVNANANATLMLMLMQC